MGTPTIRKNVDDTFSVTIDGKDKTYKRLGNLMRFHPTATLIGTTKQATVVAKDKEDLIKHIDMAITLNGNEASLEHIDVSHITDMSELFWDFPKFNGSLKGWDTSNVTNMHYMFGYCRLFNRPVEFDTTNVKCMNSMFYGCAVFNQPIQFDTTRVEDMGLMFYHCRAFNQPIRFNTANVKSMKYLLNGCYAFDQPVNFDMTSVESIKYMFYACLSFNQRVEFDVGSGDVEMDHLFDFCTKLTAHPVMHNVGESGRTIYLGLRDRHLIHIGCFIGTKEEAIDAVKLKYGSTGDKDARNAYIKDIEECFSRSEQLKE